MTTILGRACPKCGGRKRYAKSKACVTCAIERSKSQTAEYRAKRQRAIECHQPSTAPSPPRRPRNYPKFENVHGEMVPEDPIYVMFHRGIEIGEFE